MISIFHKESQKINLNHHNSQNFEGLNLKIEFLCNFSKKSIKWVCELRKHLLMRLDLNFYARNYKIHVSEAQNANASKSEKSIFWGYRSCIFLKDFVRGFCQHLHSKWQFWQFKFPKTSEKYRTNSNGLQNDFIQNMKRSWLVEMVKKKKFVTLPLLLNV